MKIQICRKFSKVNKLQKRLTLAFPDDIVIIKKCIDLCKVCNEQPAARTTKQKFKAKSISSLIRKIANS